MDLFSLQHLTMILSISVVAVTVCIVGIFLKTDYQIHVMSRWIGGTTIAFWIFYNLYYFLPKNFVWSVSLPLHVCDIIGLIAGLALITNKRQFRALLYFISLALTSQALITPVGNQDPATLRFWLFWALHGGIIVCAFFDLVIRRFKPKLDDLLFSLGCSLTYVVLVFPINVIFGWNYGYIGNSMPDGSTLVAILGPWPWRVFSIFGLAILLQVTLFSPWVVYYRLFNKNRKGKL